MFDSEKNKWIGEKGDEEVLAVCQQENERAVDIIERTILNAD